MNTLFSMIAFMTRLPVPGTHELSRRDLVRGMMMMPVIGALIGGITAAVYYGASMVLDAGLASFTALLALIFITGGLHLDGLADTFDGIMSYRTRERILAIMKDSRLGTNGAVALFIILAAKLLGIITLADGPLIIPALVAAPVLGRTAMVLSAGMGRYARNEEGLGSFVDDTGAGEVIVAMVLSALVVFPLLGIKAVAALAGVSVFSIIFTLRLGKKIGGITGDTLGACIEISETIALFMFAALRNVS